MPKPFDFSGYSITPIKPYIEPAPNAVVARFGVLRMIEKGIDLDSREDFVRSLISLNLADLNITNGVNFNPLLIQEGGTQGTYSYVSNTLSIVNKYIQDPEYLGLLLNIVGHETRHKYQHETNKTAKYFSSNQNKRTVGFLKQIPSLIGEDENARTLYLLNRSEKDSFTYGNAFAEILLTEALRNVTSTGNLKNINYIRNQLRKATALKNVELSDIRYRENDFIANHLPQFYKNCSTSFKGYLSIAKTYNNRGSFNYTQQVYLDRLENTDYLEGTDYQQSVQAAASVLAYLPKREFVKDFIDFALSARDKNVASDALHYLTQYAVPLTQNDVTRVFVCSDMYKGSASHFSLPFSALSKIDEEFLVQNLVVSQGYEAASKIIEDLKNEDTSFPINFLKVDRVLSTYSNTPIFVYNGREFAGCSQVLDYVINSLVREGKVSSEDLYQVKGELSQNLANIVSNFENPTATNIDFNSALERFISNPFEKQFEAPSESVDETSKVLSPEVASKSAEYSSSVKEQKTEENPDLTKFTAKNENGVSYADELIKSLDALAKSLKELAEVLNSEEFQKAFVKICDKNSNGERVLDKDEILKDSQDGAEEFNDAASCVREDNFNPESPIIDGGVEGLKQTNESGNILPNGVIIGGGEKVIPPSPQPPVVPPPVA